MRENAAGIDIVPYSGRNNDKNYIDTYKAILQELSDIFYNSKEENFAGTRKNRILEQYIQIS